MTDTLTLEEKEALETYLYRGARGFWRTEREDRSEAFIAGYRAGQSETVEA